MKHGSLFSGIGGFDLASEWMGWENVFHCEWNPFGQKILKHYWPKAESFEDITKTDFTKYANKIDILTGGFPCQPYSSAGKRKGKEDDRHLWPEMLRAISEISPRFVVGENVRGLLNWGGGWYSTRCVLNWKIMGIKSRPLLYLRRRSMHPMEGTGFGLLPTVESFDWNSARTPQKWEQDKKKYLAKGINLHCNLRQQARLGMLPTPTAMDSTNATATMKSTQVKDGSMHSVTLNRAMAMGMLPTPQAQEGEKITGLENQDSITKRIRQITGTISHLNPRFVAEMMGFPTTWTELPFQNGDKNPSKDSEMP